MRVFLASTLPDALHVELGRQIESLARSLPEDSVRWVPPGNIHLTLKFLGEITAEQAHSAADCARAAAAGAYPFTLSAGGLGVFPNLRRPNVIWVGVEGGDGRLSDLQSRLESGLARAGFEAEARPFHSHLTLGRTRRGLSRPAREALSKALSHSHIGTLGEWDVEALVLMRSDLRPDGAQYTPVEIFPLAARPN